MVPTGHIEEIPDEGENPVRHHRKGTRGYPHFREAASLSGPREPHSALRCVSSARSGRDAGIHTAVTEHGPNDLTVRMEMEQVFAVENERRQSRTGCHARAYF